MCLNDLLLLLCNLRQLLCLLLLLRCLLWCLLPTLLDLGVVRRHARLTLPLAYTTSGLADLTTPLVRREV